MVKCLIISSGFGLNKILNKTLIERIKDTLRIKDVYLLIDRYKLMEYKDVLGDEFKYVYKDEKETILNYLSLDDRLIVVNDNVFFYEKIKDKYIKGKENYKFNNGYILNVEDIRDLKKIQEIKIDKLLILRDLVDTYKISRKLNKKINEVLVNQGVIIEDINNVYIDEESVIGNGTFIESGTHIKGNSIIGDFCYISGNIENSRIDDRVVINKSEIISSVIESYANIGPHSYIHDNCLIGKDTYIGSYVEMKKCIVGCNCKIKHQSVLLDCNIADNCNIGAGVITANYDSKMKHITNIGNRCFIGCNSVLIAPLTIKDDVYIAANSTITRDIDNDEFAISRVPQINKKKRRNLL